MTKDPICGMTVNPDTPLHTERDGQTYPFCSEHAAHRDATLKGRDNRALIAPCSALLGLRPVYPADPGLRCPKAVLSGTIGARLAGQPP